MNIICSSSPLVPFNLSVSSPFRLLRSLLPVKIVQPLRCHHFTLALFTPSLPLLKFYCPGLPCRVIKQLKLTPRGRRLAPTQSPSQRERVCRSYHKFFERC